MWPGPYGEWGSRKYLLSSLDQSLKRMGLEYVDIFYSHRPDPETPLEETMMALDQVVRQGKALYVGISNYPAEQHRGGRGDPAAPRHALPHPPAPLLDVRPLDRGRPDSTCSSEEGIGCIAFSPLAQGLLTDKYLAGIPKGSRASTAHGFLRPEHVTPEKVEQARKLNEIAQARGQSLAQMALLWVLRRPVVTSALIGASSVAQLDENLDALKAPALSAEELARIETILK